MSFFLQPVLNFSHYFIFADTIFARCVETLIKSFSGKKSKTKIGMFVKYVNLFMDEKIPWKIKPLT